MKKNSLLAGVLLPFAFLSSVPAQESGHKLRLFHPRQYDSVLSLVPAGDSLSRTGDIVAVGSDGRTGDIVVISLDKNGNPGKFVCPAPALKQAAARPRARPPRDQSGRVWLIIETTVKSAFVYPMAFGTIVDSSARGRGRLIGGASLLTCGGMLYAAFAFTKNMELGYGKAAEMNYGSTLLGGYYPFLAASFLRNETSIDDRYQTADPYSGDARYRSPTATDYFRAWTSMLGFPLGVYLGSRWQLVDKDDFGKATLMEYFSQTAGLLAFALPAFYYDHPGTSEKRNYLGMSTGLAMVLLPAGYCAGWRFIGSNRLSAGRGTLPWVTGAMGTLTGFGLASLSGRDCGVAGLRTFLAAGIAGYAGGTYLGLSYDPGTHYTYWQSVFIGAAAACGAGIGEAFPLLANANNKRAYIIAGVLGGWIGFVVGEKLSLSLFEKSDRDRRASSLQFNVPGLAALPILLASKERAPSALSETAAALPLVTVRWGFK